MTGSNGPSQRGAAVSEPGICRGSEDSRGNENRKLLEKIFSVEKKIDMHTFFYEN